MQVSNIINDNLIVQVDWLEFTIKTISEHKDVILLMGLDISDFNLMDKGGIGYKRLMIHNTYNIKIYYDGSQDMGVHVSVSGSAVHFALESFSRTLREITPFGESYNIPFEYDVSNILPYYLKEICKYGTFSRIDLAVDDYGCNYFSIDDVVDLLVNKSCVSQFRNWRNLCENTLLGEKTGHTVYMGSRKSEIYLRVYDKRLEQNKGIFDDDKKINMDWIRWELELKGDKANEVVKMLIDKQNGGVVCIGILSRYVRFINLDNNNRSRCTTNAVWSKFIGNIAPLKISVPQTEKTLDMKEEWYKRQLAPTVAGIVYAHHGDLSIITDNFVDNFDRLSKETKKMFEKARIENERNP